MIPVAEPVIGDREATLVKEVLDSGWISPNGSFVDEFETRFKEFVGTKYAFATSTGTAALHLSLLAADVGHGDEVIVPSLTWIGCANVIRYVGATPVFVDIDEETYTMDVRATRDAVTENTAAIMPVHLYGHPCDMDGIVEIAEQHDLVVIEDAAEALGATYRGTQVGSIGTAGCYSFYGNKILTTGQGGMITLDDDELAARIRTFRRDGMSERRKYFHPVVGYNYRLTNLQAAIGVAQLERANTIIERKRQNANLYRNELSNTSVRVSPEATEVESVFWMNTAVFTSKQTKESVITRLNEERIETRPFFYPLHEQPPYRANDEQSLPIAEDRYRKGINLPSSSELTPEEIRTVCESITEVVE